MNLKQKYISLFCIILLSLTFSSNSQKLSFLQEDESHFVKLESNSSDIVIDETQALTIADGTTKTFTLDILKSGEVLFDFQLDYIDNKLNQLVSIAAVIKLEKDYEPETVTILMTTLYLNGGAEPSVYQVKNARSHSLTKGKYNGTLIFFITQDTTLDCKGLSLRAINY